ncbi:MAG: hypothetical protein ACPGUV_05990 [Polyangiales bacterium]
MQQLRTWLTFGVLLLLGCEELTRQEAQEAVDELQLSAQTTALTANSIELGTSFTLGAAVETAAVELRDFIRGQLPCATLSLQGATLSIDYGSTGSGCTYRGVAYFGQHAITLERADANETVVQHRWTAMRNSVVQVDGEATVRWQREAQTRSVSHQLTWTRLADGVQVEGRGERSQQALPDGIEVGFQVDGDRAWTSVRGDWQLDIEGVQMRWTDPVPQAGRYTLTTPADKQLSVGFTRLDASSIEVIVTNARREHRFQVRSAP